jgi:hypothetical protein
MFLLIKMWEEPQPRKEIAAEFYKGSVNAPTAFNQLISKANRQLERYFDKEGRDEPYTFSIVGNRIQEKPRTNPIAPTAERSDFGLRMLHSLHGGGEPLAVAYTEIVLFYNKKTGLLRDGAGSMIDAKDEVEQRYAVGRSDLEAVALLWDLCAREPKIPHQLVRADLRELRELLTQSSVIFLGSPFDRGDYVDVVESPRYAFRVRSSKREIELVSITKTGEVRLDSTNLFGQHKDGKEFAIVKRFRTGHGTHLLLLAGSDVTSTMAVVEMFFRTTQGHLKHLRQILGPHLNPHRQFERALELVRKGETASIKRVLPFRGA